MGCLCAAHARGANALDPCNTDEHAIETATRAARECCETNGWMRGGFAEGDRKARNWLRGYVSNALRHAGFRLPPTDRQLDKLIAAALAEVEVRKHPRSDAHVRVKVTTVDGHVFACDWAFAEPSAMAARRAWYESPRLFRPFDESTGRYVS